MNVIVILALVFFGIAGLIVLLMSWNEKKEQDEFDSRWKPTASEISESDKLMKTDFFKKIKEEIWNSNINGIKTHVKHNYSGIGVRFTCIRVEKDCISEHNPFDDFTAKIKFAELGYKPLTQSQVRVLLYSLGRLQGYKNYKCDYTEKCHYVKYDFNYWKSVYDSYKGDSTKSLKNIY